MTAGLVTLTLLVPAALEEEVEGIMIEHEPTAAAGFTVRDVRYHGDAAAYRSIVEQIRGHTRMIEVTVTLPAPDAASLLALIGENLPRRGLTFRTNPAGEIGAIG